MKVYGNYNRIEGEVEIDCVCDGNEYIDEYNDGYNGYGGGGCNNP